MREATPSKKIKTGETIKLLLTKLYDFEKQGHDHVKILEKSIVGGYQGIFSDKSTLKNGYNPDYNPQPELSKPLPKSQTDYKTALALHEKQNKEIEEHTASLYKYDEVKQVEGEYSWGPQARKVYYYLGPKERAKGEERVKNYFEKKR